MLEVLARQSLAWAQLRVAQVDERMVAAADARRNLTMQRAALVEDGPLPAAQLLAMPVDHATAEDMREYAQLLGALDVVHLGLGADGHTASLLPGDTVLTAQEPVAISGKYQGTKRMTLTFPTINAARRIVWLVTGDSKRRALRQLLAGEGNVPALQVRRSGVVVFADAAAAGEVDTA